MPQALPVPQQALLTSLVESRLNLLARYGAHSGGGMQRLVYSPAWSAAAAELQRWLLDDGLATHRDAVGNIYGVLPGSMPGRSIVTGSHLDTALIGGRYDGTLGVVAGSIALKILREQYGTPKRTIELLATCDEEASRFHSNFWGSRAVAGLADAAETAQRRDSDGIALADAMRTAGLDPATVAAAKRTDIGAFIELHIEQGPVLHRANLPIAVVTAITGVRQMAYTLQGRADHAGTTPMTERRDPVVALGRIVPELRRLALELGPPAVATVGQIHVEPGWPNIVAQTVRFSVDARYPDEVGRHAYYARINQRIRDFAGEEGVGVSSETLLDQPAAQMEPELVQAVLAAAQRLALPCEQMVSGAGHDTQVLRRVGVPTTMLFVASRDGRSHCPEEFSELHDCVIGTAVLIETLRRLAYDESKV